MEQLLQSLLNLPDIRVLKSEYTARGDLIVHVESTLKNANCRRCGREIRQIHGYDQALRLRHLPIFERRVYIEIRPKRALCRGTDDDPAAGLV